MAAAISAVAHNPGNESVTIASQKHAEVMTMQSKKKQKLLQKVDGGRRTKDVMSSAPCGAAEIQKAPKLSDFGGDVIKHAAAMRGWCAKNLPKKAIETATRARCNRSSADGTFWLLLF